MLERSDAYDVYEVKYYTAPLGKTEMWQEAEKIRNLRGLQVGKIGFVASSGYETTDVPYDLIDGNMLYESPNKNMQN